MNGLDPALEGSVDFEKVVDPLSELMVDDFLLNVRSGRVEVVPEDTLLPLLLWLLLLPLAKYFLLGQKVVRCKVSYRRRKTS